MRTKSSFKSLGIRKTTGGWVVGGWVGGWVVGGGWGGVCGVDRVGVGWGGWGGWGWMDG